MPRSIQITDIDSKWRNTESELPPPGKQVLVRFAGKLYVALYDGREWRNKLNEIICVELWQPIPPSTPKTDKK